MQKFDTLDALMNAVVLDCYGHCRTEADVRVSCGSPSLSGSDTKSYRREISYTVNGREDCRHQETVTLDKNDSVSDYENEMLDSLEGTLARAGLQTARSAGKMLIDTQALHRAQYTTGEVADMLGVSEAQVVDAYRQGHRGKEPSGRELFPLYGVLDLSGPLGLFPEQAVQRIAAYNASKMPVRKAV